MQVIIAYPDGRTGETSEEGFAETHKQYGAAITAYVGADGKSYPATDAGKKEAMAATDSRWTPYNEEVARRQAEALGVGAETVAKPALNTAKAEVTAKEK